MGLALQIQCGADNSVRAAVRTRDGVDKNSKLRSKRKGTEYITGKTGKGLPRRGKGVLQEAIGCRNKTKTLIV